MRETRAWEWASERQRERKFIDIGDELSERRGHVRFIYYTTIIFLVIENN